MDSNRIAFRCRWCQVALVLLLPAEGCTPEAWATTADRARRMGWTYSAEDMLCVCPDCAETARAAVREERRP